ncbi:hypothetical protein D9X30_5722 [Cupriavidus sp. U2]|uniref:hypothetical protein n=1 Tax=Cupriavidus sp. U2 TaxID=2920269 RepID=UPI00129E1812|nr:hypothetical protein [Cupriavidus sp. U2]KAI3590139.1 hypothetical protein D9X30_5722 [Cupriavidus sp. U2]
MNYSAFKVKAVVDWIELEITTEVHTQQQWIQHDLRRILDLPEGAKDTWVEPVNPGPGGVSCMFRIRFHDAPANSYGELERIMDALAARKSFAAPPNVHAIEVAADFYAKGQAKELDLVSLTKRLQTTIIARGNPRQFDPAIGGNRPGTLDLDPRLNLRIGNKGDDISWQVYYKRTDKGGVSLSSGDQRARAEFTLRGAALAESGLTDFASLKGYRFEVLSDNLRFGDLKPLDRIVEDMNAFAAYAVRHLWSNSNGSVTTWPVGWRAHRVDRRKGLPRKVVDRKQTSHAEADYDLNRRVRRSLSDLSGRFSAQN